MLESNCQTCMLIPPSPSSQGLALANELSAEGRRTFTFGEIVERLGKSKTATANLLKRMETSGLVVRVRRGHYLVRQLGMLGIPAAYEDIPLSVGAALRGIPHRIAYRTALYEHDLLAHPPGAVQIAAQWRFRIKSFSGLPVQVITESPKRLEIGRMQRGESYISDLHRAILESAQRPLLVGGIEVLATSLVLAAPDLRAEMLMRYARELGWASGLRRLGSLSDSLEIESLQNKLQPFSAMNAEIDLEPGTGEAVIWRDRHWRLRWTRSADEMRSVAEQ